MNRHPRNRAACVALVLVLGLATTPAFAFGPIGDTALWQGPLAWFHHGIAEVSQTLAGWFGLAGEEETAQVPDPGALLTKEGVNTDPNGCTSPSPCG